MLITDEKFKQKEVYEEGQEKPDIITLRLNKEERQLLDKCKSLLEQKKDSTAIKTLWVVGSNVLHDKKTGFILRAVFKNKRNNRRSGLVDFD